MALTNPWDKGNPSGYQRSSLWDTDWGKAAYNNKNMANYANQMGQQANNYLSGGGQLGAMKNRIAGYTNQIMPQVMSSGPFAGGTGQANWGFGYPAPNDPKVQEYQEQIMGQQRNMADDYVRRAASAGVTSSRGGMGVAGGPSREAMLQSEAIRQLARGQSDRYDQAMGYGANYYGAAADAWKTAAGLGRDLLGQELQAAISGGDIGAQLAGLQYQGLAGQNDWDKAMFGARREDYGIDKQNQMNWDQNSWQRQAAYKDWQNQINAQQEARDRAANLDNLTRQVVASPRGEIMGDNLMNALQYLQANGILARQGTGQLGTPGIRPNEGTASYYAYGGEPQTISNPETVGNNTVYRNSYYTPQEGNIDAKKYRSQKSGIRW